MKYVYPAVFTQEKSGMYSVNFHDVAGCFTCGDNLIDAYMMAQDVLAFSLFNYERDCIEIPEMSHISSVKTADNEFATLVFCDTIDYQKRAAKKSVKKTLTIPHWLDDLAVRRGINFSKLLQSALSKELDVE